MHTPSDNERAILAQSARRFLAKEYCPPHQAATSQNLNWKRFADLGWLGLPFAESDGGVGGSALDVAALVETLGEAGVVEPYIASIVLAGGLVAACAPPGVKDSVLGRMIAGETLVAFAHEEASRGPGSHGLTATAVAGGAYSINGRKTLVLGGAQADWLVVTAKPAGKDALCFLIPTRLEGVEAFAYRLSDGSLAADLAFHDVSVGRSAALGMGRSIQPALEEMLDRAAAAACAETIGVMQAAFSQTIAYCNMRRQFGRQLSGFQVLQHRLVDMWIAIQESRSMANWAAASVLQSEPVARRRAVSAAKVKIASSARFVGQQAIQLHGAIGITEELAVGHHYKRLEVLGALYGTTRYHLDRYEKTRADGFGY